MLSECAAVAPVGDPEGPWRVQLQTGTVLLGHLRDDAITVALPIGPDEISVPLAEFVSLHVESWSPVGQAREAVSTRDERRGAPAMDMTGYPTADVPGVAPAPARTAEEAGWFDNSALQATKEAQAQ